MSHARPKPKTTPDEIARDILLKALENTIHPKSPIYREVLARYQRSLSPELRSRIYYRVIEHGHGSPELRAIVIPSNYKHVLAGISGPVTTYRTLDGRYVKLPVNINYHTVSITRIRMKCNCPDALMTSSRADKYAEKILGRPVSIGAKYVLCKHTLTLLPVCLAENIITPQDAYRLLRKAILVFGLARGIRLPPAVVAAIARQ